MGFTGIVVYTAAALFIIATPSFVAVISLAYLSVYRI